MDKVLIIVLVIVLAILGLIALYISVYNRLQKYLIRINESETIIDECLRKKYDILVSMETIINSQTELKQDNLSSIKSDEMSSFEVDRKLTQIADLFKKIKLDYEKELNISTYHDNEVQLKKNNEKCDATKAYYNKNITELNMLVKKFPTNVIAKLHGFKEKAYFDNKNMSDENIFDFKI